MSAPADVAASAAGEDQVAPLGSPAATSASAASSAAARARVVHGHKPSAMGSMDLSEESRDTVEVKDSDTWYPQFSPSATLGPAKKIDDDKKSGLSALLSSRMDRARFQERFLRPGSEEEAAANAAMALNSARAKAAEAAAREASAESLFNRSAKLGALLANRPDRRTLESHNVLKAPQGAGAGSKGKTTTTNAFAGMQAQLEASKRKDRLNALLAARPTLNELSKRGVLPTASASAAGAGADASEPRPAERLATAKSVLGDFILARPSAEQLVKQKIITDVGDLPGGLERHTRTQESVLEPALLERGSLAGGRQVVQVSLGFSHSLALDGQGRVHVFGSGANGRLGVGEGSFGEVAEPRELDAAAFGGEPVQAVDAGENHSLAVTRGGALFTWGTGAWGRLGLGDQDDAGVPKRVVFPKDTRIVRASAGAYHTLALSDKGELFAFGWNKNGRCGVGRTAHPSLLLLTPQRVAFFSTLSPASSIRSFEAGSGASFVVLADGRLFTWGQGALGATGHGEEADLWEPKQLELRDSEGKGVQVRGASVGAAHMLAVDAEGRLFAWGSNERFQTGVDQSASSPSPAPAAGSAAAASSASSPPPPAGVLSPRGGIVLTPTLVTLPGGALLSASSGAVESSAVFAAGKAHSLVVDASGAALFAFGAGARGVLGTGSEADVPLAARVEAAAFQGAKLKQVDTAWTHSAAVTDSGKLFVWGAKNNGRTGL